VALRPEPFGALAYHYGNRKLTFLRSADLVALVGELGRQPSIEAALDAIGAEPGRRRALSLALSTLEKSEVIRAR